MTSKQFEAWRTANGLSLRRAAKVLGLSYLTVLSYSRGYRHDDHRLVTIPEPVALACEAISARACGGSAEPTRRSPLAPEEPDAQLPTWGDVTPAVKRRALYALKTKPVFGKVPPKQVFLTKLDRFLPLAAEIVDWLHEHTDKGHRLHVIRHPDPAEGPLVLLEIADPDQAFEFRFRWRGYNSEDGDQP